MDPNGVFLFKVSLEVFSGKCTAGRVSHFMHRVQFKKKKLVMSTFLKRISPSYPLALGNQAETRDKSQEKVSGEINIQFKLDVLGLMETYFPILWKFFFMDLSKISSSHHKIVTSQGLR